MAKKTVLNSSLDKVIKVLKEAIAVSETQKLRDNAQAAGWPTDVANTLMVSPNNQGLGVEYPANVRDKVLTLEYGTQDVPPSPVIRSTILGVE
jgi:hypothetical protein